MRKPAPTEVVLKIGDFYFGGGRTRVRTLLGSCVAIVLWHPQLRIGGMCHYLLPRRGATEVAKRASEGHYAEGAMQLFMRELRETKTRPEDYVAKLFGGGCMFKDSSALGAGDPLEDEQGVAVQNVQAGRDLLRRHGFTITAEQLGGLGSRVVVFELWSGDVWIRRGDPLGPRKQPAGNELGRLGAKLTADAVLTRSDVRVMHETTERIVALGASTGGTQALETVLVGLPKESPGVLVVQHMPARFTAAFAARLDVCCQVTVREATHGERLLPGHVLIAPGGRHMMLRRSGAHYYIEVVDGALVNRHKPSVDVLFRSVANSAGRNALGIIMTGMGDDGARGLKEMRACGAATLAQDEATCVVYGMPKEAIRLGAAERSVALEDIAKHMLAWARSEPNWELHREGS